MELAKVGYVDEQPNPLDKRSKIIRVIKQDENVSEYVRKEFGHYFTLESFKGWLKGIEKNCVLKGQIHLNKIPKDQWNNDVADLFNEHYVMGKNGNVFLAKQDTIVLTKEQTPSSETASEMRQNYELTEKDGKSLNFNATNATFQSSFSPLKLEDLTFVHWADEFYGEHECCVCGYQKLTSWQAEDFKGNKHWICDDCKQEWEKRREVQ